MTKKSNSAQELNEILKFLTSYVERIKDGRINHQKTPTMEEAFGPGSATWRAGRAKFRKGGGADRGYSFAKNRMMAKRAVLLSTAKLVRPLPPTQPDRKSQPVRPHIDTSRPGLEEKYLDAKARREFLLDRGYSRTYQEDLELADLELYLNTIRRDHSHLRPRVRPSEMLKLLCEQCKPDETVLLRVFRSRSRLQAVLRGAEVYTEEAKKLGRLFHVSPTNFID